MSMFKPFTPNPGCKAPSDCRHQEFCIDAWHCSAAQPQQKSAPDLNSPWIVIDTIGGNCPVQAEGTIDGHPFYFRARGQHWNIGIGGEPVGAPAWEHEEAYGDGPFAAGYMPVEEAMQFIRKAAQKFHNKEPSMTEPGTPTIPPHLDEMEGVMRASALDAIVMLPAGTVLEMIGCIRAAYPAGGTEPARSMELALRLNALFTEKEALTAIIDAQTVEVQAMSQRVAALFAENQDLIQMVDDLHARFSEIRGITTQTLATKERAWTALSQIDHIARKG